MRHCPRIKRLMEDNQNVDELIEIKPDVIPVVDIQEEIDEDADMKIVPDVKETVNVDVKTATDIAEEDEDADMKIVPEKVRINESDDFSKELYDIETEEADMKLISEIGKSLQEETEQNLTQDEFKITDVDGEAGQTGTVPVAGRSFKAFLKSIPLWAYIVSGASVVILTVTVVILIISLGRSAVIDVGSDYAAGLMNYQPVEDLPVVDIPDDIDTDILPDIEVIDESSALITPEPTAQPLANQEEEQQVYNILILGEENLEKGSTRGRSDLIMIATVNKADKSLKLTSVLRDILVAIPDHSDNRLNAAYAMGGVSLTYQTLANNLGVSIDNYVCVDFDSFEKIIDAIGGVDMKLTNEEANYLNKTNYIRSEALRNLKKGVNHLNGEQALGYCRIRKVGTASKEYSDFGRTSRQRELIESICKSLSDMSIKQLMSFCETCLPYIRTDIDADTLERYLTDAYEIGLDKDIYNYRIPIDGTYSDANLRGMLVTKVDLRENAEQLHRFIYGE